MVKFYDRLDELYKEFKEKIEKTISELREKMSVKPKYIELPDKYYEILKKENILTYGTPEALVSGINDLSLKIKAQLLVNYATITNKELNKVYSDLKIIEKKLFEFTDKTLNESFNVVDEMKKQDLKLDGELKKIFNTWIELDKVRNMILEEINSFISEVKKDYREELDNIDLFVEKILGLEKEFDEYLERVKSETRDRRKILLRYLCFAEGVRTKGVKLYLPVYRIIVTDSRGKLHEIYKVYNGNLKVNDKMIETIRKMLDEVDKDFIDSMKKYIRTNYTGLRRFYLLTVLKNVKGGRK